MQEYISSGDFFRLMVHFSQEGYLLSASAPGKIPNRTDPITLKEQPNKL
jgi:hypothetical protein